MTEESRPSLRVGVAFLNRLGGIDRLNGSPPDFFHSSERLGIKLDLEAVELACLRNGKGSHRWPFLSHSCDASLLDGGMSSPGRVLE